MRSFRRFIPVLSVVLAMPAAQALHAQGAQDAARSQNEQAALPTPNTPSAQSAQPAAGPTLSTASVGVRVSKDAPAKTPPKFAETRHNQTLMIVGGAALIVGAIIGDTPGTLIMIGGAGVGLYGLYKYLE